MKTFRIISYLCIFLICLIFGFIGLINKISDKTNNNTEIVTSDINIICTLSSDINDENEVLIGNKEQKVLIVLNGTSIKNNIYSETYTYLTQDSYTLAKTSITDDVTSYTFNDETFAMKKVSTFDLNLLSDITLSKPNIDGKLTELGYTCQ